MEEFGGGKRDIALCSSCGAAYYYKSWHHNLLHHKNLGTKEEVHVMLCPACAMWKARQWEGELQIARVPERMKKQVTHTIFSVADEAYNRDPMHRVFSIEVKRGKITAYFSENQLASRTARKIFSSLKKHFTKPLIHRGKGGDAVLVTMDWMG